MNPPLAILPSQVEFEVLQVATVPPELEPVLLLGLNEINERSGGRYPASASLAIIKRTLALFPQENLMLITRDPRLGVVCGFCTVQLMSDGMGRPMAFISRGWIARGYRGEPFDAVLPVIEQWARQLGAKSILSGSQHAARVGEETDAKLERGARAYGRWLGKRGFQRQETLYEKEL